MNLKESFRYMNFLNTMINVVNTELLYDDQLLTTTKETHLRHRVNPDVEDEIIEDVAKSDKSYTANDLLLVYDKLINEVEKTAKAIAKAKKNMDFDMDYATSINKKRQTEIETLRKMSNLKAVERKDRGTGYKFNNEGNQVPYYYDIERVKVINFDRKEVKKKIKNLTEICDKTSEEIDKALINTEVKLKNAFDFADTLEDIIETIKKDK